MSNKLEKDSMRKLAQQDALQLIHNAAEYRVRLDNNDVLATYTKRHLLKKISAAFNCF